MADDIDLVAEYRELQGKGASRRLRRTGGVPAIIYGGGRAPRMITLQQNKLRRALEEESFYSSILNIKIGEKEQPVILKDIQRHPARPDIVHMDLQRIVAGEPIKMNVPIHFLGEDIAPGVKQDGGVVSHLILDVEIICLPKNLPEYLEIDVSEMQMDDIQHLSDIKLPEGVEIPELALGEDHDQPLVSIHKPRAIVEEVDEDAAEEPSAEVPTIGDEEDDDKDKD